MNSDESISMAIKVRLLRLGSNQKALANKSGVNESQLCTYLTGKVGWRVEVLENLLGPLGWRNMAELTSAAEEERRLASLPMEVTA